ncbi:Hypothetical protein CINCED_3A019554 [Cinara cedri]|uniref:MADF domain-containing protein n=1 Tax=Cinara cedri TaxID=506608 RepID=A0A5E4NDJ8_9HEMI|nr:Hypothetical protein CINCED_3A019554 [Cinara cedri]
MRFFVPECNTIFKGHVRKKKALIKSGVDVYQPKWFAFEFMESFLQPVYKSQTPTNTPDTSVAINEQNQSVKTENTTESTNTIVPEQPNQTPSRPNPTNKRRFTPPELQKVVNQMKEEFNMIKNVTTKRGSDKEDDEEYDLLGKLLAKKIRKLPEREREEFLYEIQGVYINKLCNANSFSTHSNASSTEQSDPTHQIKPPSNVSSHSESTCPIYQPNDQLHLNKNILVDKQNTSIKFENYYDLVEEKNIKQEILD